MHVRDEVRLSCARRGNSITIVEQRAPWKPELLGDEWTQLRIAQLRYDASAGTWSAMPVPVYVPQGPIRRRVRPTGSAGQ